MPLHAPWSRTMRQRCRSRRPVSTDRHRSEWFCSNMPTHTALFSTRILKVRSPPSFAQTHTLRCAFIGLNSSDGFGSMGLSNLSPQPRPMRISPRALGSASLARGPRANRNPWPAASNSSARLRLPHRASRSATCRARRIGRAGGSCRTKSNSGSSARFGITITSA